MFREEIFDALSFWLDSGQTATIYVASWSPICIYIVRSHRNYISHLGSIVDQALSQNNIQSKEHVIFAHILFINDHIEKFFTYVSRVGIQS